MKSMPANNNMHVAWVSMATDSEPTRCDGRFCNSAGTMSVGFFHTSSPLRELLAFHMCCTLFLHNFILEETKHTSLTMLLTEISFSHSEIHIPSNNKEPFLIDAEFSPCSGGPVLDPKKRLSRPQVTMTRATVVK